MAYCEHCDHCNADILSGGAIRGARKERGWTLRELARRLEISPSYMCDIELGRRPISIKGIGSIILAELGVKRDGEKWILPK